MKLTPVTVDLETYWSKTHTLSKMSPIVYAMHPDTEVICCAAKVGNEMTNVSFGEATIAKQMRAFDWSDKIVVGHNMSEFDAMILRWRFGVKPAMWACTLAMARPMHAKTTGLSLRSLVEHYGIGCKDNTILINTQGKRLSDFTPDEIDQMRYYNRQDVDLCHLLFNILLPRTSKDEMRLIDATIRMLVEPGFEVNRPLLVSTLVEERERKRLMLLDVATAVGAYSPGMSEDEAATAAGKVLASSSKFAAFLRDMGVDPPMKPSPTNPEKTTFALAKTDEAFLALQDHADPLVSAAARARLGVKSTILESRIEAFLAASDAVKGRKPIALKYYGADTTGRWSGSMGMNDQNLPRIPRDKQGNVIPKSTNALRQCLQAPSGRRVVVADLSGIELRVNHFLWKVPSSMALFQADPEKADLYKEFASALYGVSKADVTKDQRQVGKVAHLGLGFGAGSTTFRKVAKLMAGIDLTEKDAADVVSKWRGEYSEIVRGWKTCHAALGAIYAGEQMYIDPWGLCYTTNEGIKTPKGMIYYPELRQEEIEGKVEWVYGRGRHKARIYAGKVTENIVQHLARCVLADNLLKIKKLTSYYPKHTVHDELIYVVPKDVADTHLATVQKVMRTPPEWWPELVTWSEGDTADTYGDAK